MKPATTIRFGRGDIILRKGKYALVWDAIGPRIRIFPLYDLEDGGMAYDAFMVNMPALQRITQWNVIGVSLNEARIESSDGWLRLPDMVLPAMAVASIDFALHHFGNDCGVQKQWPFYGSLVEGKAPILAS